MKGVDTVDTQMVIKITLYIDRHRSIFYYLHNNC